VIAGGADGLYVVELITRNAQGNAIKIQPDITQPTDSGMGLFKNNALYGVNIGGDGWYGSIDNPGFIQNQIQVLNASL
jgi:hypothetical protein